VSSLFLPLWVPMVGCLGEVILLRRRHSPPEFPAGAPVHIGILPITMPIVESGLMLLVGSLCFPLVNEATVYGR